MREKRKNPQDFDLAGFLGMLRFAPEPLFGARARMKKSCYRFAVAGSWILYDVDTTKNTTGHKSLSAYRRSDGTVLFAEPERDAALRAQD
jgi:hypothetical protein